MSTRSRRDDKNSKSHLKKFDEISESNEDKSSTSMNKNKNPANAKPDENLIAELQTIAGNFYDS